MQLPLGAREPGGDRLAVAAAVAESVTANANELGDAVEGLSGATAGPLFRQLWAAHVEQLQDDAAGLSDADDAARDQAKRRFVVTEADLGRLLSTASGGGLTPQAAEDALRMHVDTLLAQRTPTPPTTTPRRTESAGSASRTCS